MRLRIPKRFSASEPVPGPTPCARNGLAARLAGTVLGLVFALNAQAATHPGLLWSQATPAPTDRSTPAPQGPRVIQNSELDAELFYQLFISELRLRQNDPGYAYQVYLELAKQRRNAQLFQRSVEIALSARAGEQALTAARAWHHSLPKDRQAVEYTVQILMALGRSNELADPLGDLIRLSPTEQQPALLAALPRSMARLPDRKGVAQVIDDITQPWRDAQPGLAEAWAASAEAWLQAGDTAQAHARYQKARALNPRLVNVGLLAVDLMGQHPDAEAGVKQQLAEAPSAVVRLAYARKLVATQRLDEAAIQLDGILVEQPDNAMAWLTLGAVRTELKQLDPAEQAIRRFLGLAAAEAERARAEPGFEPVDIDLGYLRMAQIAELRRQLPQADDWLRKADPDGRKLNIQVARAKLLAAQNRLNDARALIRAIPEDEPRDAIVKINAETQLLREARQYEAAYKLLHEATQRFTDDADLLYDRAMMAEHLRRHDEAETTLRRVFQLKPDHPHAYNALGYSLADRGVRLDEARRLINKALELKPGDPYITDSLGWLEFRAGNRAEALKWLRQAYVTKADSEIAAHLGEVLWVMGDKDEAIRIWKEGQKVDARNETLIETLKRLQAPL